MINIKYPTVRSHRVIHAAPQFRPIRRGSRRRGIERKYETKKGDRITITLFEELDIADQSVLLCLLAMARVENRGAVISSGSKTPENQELRAALALDGYAATQDIIAIHSNSYEILVELGRTTDKRSYQWLKKSITRLSRVSLLYESENRWWTFNLLSANGLHVSGKLSIAINPLSARAILTNSYALIHLGERAELTTDEARALHFVLCGLVDMDKERVMSVDIIADRVYSRYDDAIDDATIRRRRKNVIDASSQLNGLAYWSVTVIGRGAKAAIRVARKQRKDFVGVS